MGWDENKQKNTFVFWSKRVAAYIHLVTDPLPCEFPWEGGRWEIVRWGGGGLWQYFVERVRMSVGWWRGHTLLRGDPCTVPVVLFLTPKYSPL